VKVKQHARPRDDLPEGERDSDEAADRAAREWLDALLERGEWASSCEKSVT